MVPDSQEFGDLWTAPVTGSQPKTLPPGTKPLPRYQSLTLKVHEPAAGIRVVRVSGELDMLTSPLLTQCLDEQLVARPRQLVIDLAEVDFLSSDGLPVLIDAQDQAREAAIGIYLTGVLTNQPVARPLEITGLLAVLPIREDLDALVADLSEG